MRQVFSKVTKATDRAVLYTRFGRQEYSSTSSYFFFFFEKNLRPTDGYQPRTSLCPSGAVSSERTAEQSYASKVNAPVANFVTSFRTTYNVGGAFDQSFILRNFSELLPRLPSFFFFSFQRIFIRSHSEETTTGRHDANQPKSERKRFGKLN